MKDMFKGYYRPTDDEFKKMWDEGVFVFDTNVLLNLYRYKKETRDAVLEILYKINDKVWIPYQVALEFHRNRLSVISEQNKVLNDFKSSIRVSIDDIEKKYKALQLDKRHSDIQAEPILEQFQNLSNKVLEELNKIKEKSLSNSLNEDETLNKVLELFKNKVGKKPENQKWLNDVFKDGEERAKNNIPPSFKDINNVKSNNKDDYRYDGLFYRAGFGDLILWKQLIEYAEEKNEKHIILITDDTKDDWMLSVSGKVISARPELVAEICHESDVENFYIYNTESFLENARKMLNTSLSEEIIKDVGKVNHTMSSRLKINSRFSEKEMELQLFTWLEEEYFIVNFLKFSDFGFDFSAHTVNDDKTLISYRYIDFNRIDKQVIEYFVNSIEKHFSTVTADLESKDVKYHVIIVLPMKDILINSMSDIRERLRSVIEEVLDSRFIYTDRNMNVTFTIGYIDIIESNVFTPLYNKRYVINS